jgi:hypothetical protein
MHGKASGYCSPIQKSGSWLIACGPAKGLDARAKMQATANRRLRGKIRPRHLTSSQYLQSGQRSSLLQARRTASQHMRGEATWPWQHSRHAIQGMPLTTQCTWPATMLVMRRILFPKRRPVLPSDQRRSPVGRFAATGTASVPMAHGCYRQATSDGRHQRRCAPGHECP